MSINSVNISGNLGADPEVRMTQAGTPVMNFRMAVNKRKRDQNGEWYDYANWVSVVVFGNRVDWLAKELHKGKRVFVTGELSYSQYEKDGTKRSSLEVVANDIDFDRPPRDQQNGGSGTYTQGYQNARQTTPQAPSGGVVQQRVQELANGPSLDYNDEDIPFGG